MNDHQWLNPTVFILIDLKPASQAAFIASKTFGNAFTPATLANLSERMLWRLIVTPPRPALHKDLALCAKNYPLVVMSIAFIPSIADSLATSSSRFSLRSGSPPVILIFSMPIEDRILVIFVISSKLRISSLETNLILSLLGMQKRQDILHLSITEILSFLQLCFFCLQEGSAAAAANTALFHTRFC
jgi:hypothetical protein